MTWYEWIEELTNDESFQRHQYVPVFDTYSYVLYEMFKENWEKKQPTQDGELNSAISMADVILHRGTLTITNNSKVARK